jgi:hypothetical protein
MMEKVVFSAYQCLMSFEVLDPLKVTLFVQLKVEDKLFSFRRV